MLDVMSDESQSQVGAGCLEGSQGCKSVTSLHLFTALYCKQRNRVLVGVAFDGCTRWVRARNNDRKMPHEFLC